ncbi:MAG: bifunctional UDP-N-acetylglucosamine diphosphorylase/glucosamine-1-phosphate N-acetyltransferase GlmU [Holosporales bacterium]|jgi:bifunctional UDP-N-acetylglucosamine pyrophosphorylase/glucosamine-1-phosphate N-acetyltransferase|nr:bifunctional UDP-N-acetylglucosamine diphosphorylase/glucosamine-1-phosphate N-acetyltransferase GlmU [Holosporales bacterium]
MDVDCLILAGGHGTRTKSDFPKIFQEVAGKAIIRYVIEACKAINPTQIISVVSEPIKDHLLFEDTKTVVQEAPRGTADAVLQAVPYIRSSHAIILCSDMPLIETMTLQHLARNSCDISLIAMTVPKELKHMAYGQVIVDDKGSFQCIVEKSDCIHSNFANSGVYKINSQLLKDNINKVIPDKKSGEFYLTELFSILKRQDYVTEIIFADEYWPFHGVNTIADLAAAEEVAQDKLRYKFMSKGVRLLDPKSVYFSYDTEIGKNVTIEQNVIFKNKVKVRDGVVVKAFSYFEDCEIFEKAIVGPFTRIRGNTQISSRSVIGNFVEIKGSIIGPEVKVKHLAYIGDTTVGSRTNIGAGVITCNFDGRNKHKSAIGEDVMVGANSSIVSPLNIGNQAVIGAGSVINKNVPKGSLAIARSRQQNKENYKKLRADADKCDCKNYD